MRIYALSIKITSPRQITYTTGALSAWHIKGVHRENNQIVIVMVPNKPQGKVSTASNPSVFSQTGKKWKL